MKKIVILTIFLLVTLLLSACSFTDIELGHGDDHDHDGDGVQDHTAEEHHDDEEPRDDEEANHIE